MIHRNKHQEVSILITPDRAIVKSGSFECSFPSVKGFTKNLEIKGYHYTIS
jgi:hypothetical protein